MHVRRHRGTARCGEDALGLDEVPPGSSAVICGLSGDEAYCERLRAMGLREGERIEVVKQAPLADPREYRVGNVHLSLRRAEARGISVGEVCAAGEPERRDGGRGRRSWAGQQGRGCRGPGAG